MNALPGKILVVDDKPEDVEAMISAFREMGIGVLYRQSVPREEECPSNVRLVIVDLDLDACGHVSDDDLNQVVLVLRRVESKTRFYLVALWSKYIKNADDWVEQLKNRYWEQTNKQFAAHFLRSFGKTLVEQIAVVNQIQKWIEQNPHAGLVLQWECTIENSRDATISDLVSTAGIDTLVKSLGQELGAEAASREFVNLMNKILVRHASRGDWARMISTLIESILAGTATTPPPVDYDWYARIHSLQAYYPVLMNEPLWTGDILRHTRCTNPCEEFAVVITPACDFAQKRPLDVKVVYGIRFDKIPEYNVDSESVPDIVNLLGKTGKGKFKEREGIINSLATGSDLPERFEVLHFVRTPPGVQTFFHLLIDFSRVDAASSTRDNSGNFSVPKGWKRLCRVDSPYIERLLQKYSSFSSRVGAPSIPDRITKELKSRISGGS